MPKKGELRKIGISITIEEDLLKQLDEFCKKNYEAPRSAIIEKALKKFLEETK